MINKYLELWLKMPANEWKTAKELGIAPATLTAMVRRNYAKASDTSPKTYCREMSSAAVLAYLLEKYQTLFTGFVDIFCHNRNLAMLCTVKDGITYDCYNNKFDISTAYKVRIGRKYFSLKNGREIL